MATRHVGRCVEVSYETDHGQFGVGVSRERGHEIAIVVEGDFLESHGFEFGLEMLGEYHLSRGGWGKIGEFVALSVELHIAQETVYYVHVSGC